HSGPFPPGPSPGAEGAGGEGIGSGPLLSPRGATIFHVCTKTSPTTKGCRMASDKKIRVAIVGLGFGSEFIPIYQAHPNAEMYAICRRNEKELNACGDRCGIK